MNPTGVAVDEAGNVFFGEVLSGPVRVMLRKRAPDGTVAELGTVVDASAGYVSAGWAFSVAVSAMSKVVYTTPVLTPGPGAEGARPGSIRRLDGSELVGALTDEPAGLAFDGAGNLHFGTKDMSALHVQLHKRTPDGTITDLGTVIETLSGVSTTWMFDLAVTRAGDVYFNTPNIQSMTGPGGGPLLGSIRKLGGGVIVPDVSEPTGLAVDAAGNLYFGEKTFGPVRIQLKKRTPDGTISDLARGRYQRRIGDELLAVRFGRHALVSRSSSRPAELVQPIWPEAGAASPALAALTALLRGSGSSMPTRSR